MPVAALRFLLEPLCPAGAGCRKGPHLEGGLRGLFPRPQFFEGVALGGTFVKAQYGTLKYILLALW